MMRWLRQGLFCSLMALAGVAVGAPGASGAASTGSMGGMSGALGASPTGINSMKGMAAAGSAAALAPAGTSSTAVTQISNEGSLPDASPVDADTAADNPASAGTEVDVPTEFQSHVAASVGRILPLFGRQLFAQGQKTFAPVDQVPVTPDYMVGPGDELVIRAWGQLDINYKGVVDRNGLLFLPKVGNINVAGVKYQDLTPYIKTAVSRNFRNFDLNVTLGQLRSVPIFVVGNAQRPGSYTVSSLSTLVSALFASGGPAKNGSLRGIQLRRGSKIIVEFDLYDLLLRGDKSRDVTLQPGDVIYIPPVSRQVAMFGSVNQPAIYEIKPGDTLESLLGVAGGLTVTAAGQSARIERIDERRSLKVLDVTLDRKGLAMQLTPGDIVSVFSITPRFDNAVTLRGNVAGPGRYPWKQGMRVRDLIPGAEALITSDYWLKRNRSAEVFVESDGALRRNLETSRTDINWDYAVVERLNAHDASTQLITFNLGKAIFDGVAEENVVLEPGDIITIFALDDLRVAQSKKVRFVRIEGEFQQSGIFQVKPGETLRQLVSSIGMTPQAYLYGAQFMRESVRKQQQQQLDAFIDRLERDVEKQSADAQASSIGAANDQARLMAEMQANKRLIAKMRAVKAQGRIVLELKPNATSLVELPDLVLEDGDRFVVPQRPSVVNVIGAVYNESAYLHRSEKTLNDYMQQAGGVTRDADRKSMYVMRADGSVLSAQQAGWFSRLGSTALMPGETVIVPVELDKTSFMRSLKDWTQILYQFGLGAAAVATLKGI